MATWWALIWELDRNLRSRSCDIYSAHWYSNQLSGDLHHLILPALFDLILCNSMTGWVDNMWMQLGSYTALSSVIILNWNIIKDVRVIVLPELACSNLVYFEHSKCIERGWGLLRENHLYVNGWQKALGLEGSNRLTKHCLDSSDKVEPGERVLVMVARWARSEVIRRPSYRILLLLSFIEGDKIMLVPCFLYHLMWVLTIRMFCSSRVHAYKSTRHRLEFC